MPSFYINCYHSLAASPKGREASRKYDIPLYVDGSIRREPDLEHDYPSISCLCRTDMFAPRLKAGDVVAYVTSRRGLKKKEPRRLTAVLEVYKTFDSHEDAAVWYRTNGLPLPSNCMVKGNRPKPLEQSHQCTPEHAGGCGGTTCDGWDASYKRRAKQFPRFVVCKKLWSDLHETAPQFNDAAFDAAFGNSSVTRVPATRPMSDFEIFKRLTGLLVRPSSR